MQTGRVYKIQFVGLGLGEHKYKFEVGNRFFENFEFSEVKQGNVIVDLTLLKQSTMMVLEFEISGTVQLPCDRCSAEFDLPISGNYRLVVKVGGEDTGNDDDIITVAAQEHELDLTQYIYEYISLSIPIKRVHASDKKGKNACDKETLKKLESFLLDEPKEAPTDPRWNDLKNIKLN